jgi:hypothetical protein
VRSDAPPVGSARAAAQWSADASGGSAEPAVSRGPGGGSPEPRLRDRPALGRRRRRRAQRTHVRWPRLAGRCGLPAAFYPAARLAASQGRCAVCGARRTAPTSGPASRPAARAPRAIRSRCPVGPGKRPREGRGGGDGDARAAHARPPPRGSGDGARVRLTRDHPHVVLRRISHVVLRYSPHVVDRCGDGCPVGRRSLPMIFMRLLRTCRARSRLGRFAFLSPTRT